MENQPGDCQLPTLSPLCPGSWHHIQNLDSFFTKISFCAWLGSSGMGGWETGTVGWGPGRGRHHPQEKPIMPQAHFLTRRHIYSYHQRSGFACILLEDVFQLG